MACGTPNGANDHRRQGEPVCAECKEAQRDYIREYRIRKAVEKDPEGELRKANENARRALDRLREVRAEYARVKRLPL